MMYVGIDVPGKDDDEGDYGDLDEEFEIGEFVSEELVEIDDD